MGFHQVINFVVPYRSIGFFCPNIWNPTLARLIIWLATRCWAGTSTFTTKGTTKGTKSYCLTPFMWVLCRFRFIQKGISLQSLHSDIYIIIDMTCNIWDVRDIRVPFRCRFTLQDVIAGLSQLSMALRQGYIKFEIKTIRNYLIGTVQCIDIDRSSMVKPPLSKTLVKGISERRGTSFSQPQRAGQSVPLVPKQSDISSAARFAIAGKLGTWEWWAMRPNWNECPIGFPWYESLIMEFVMMHVKAKMQSFF